VDRLKRRLYDRLEALRHREESGFYSEEARRLAAEILPNVPSAGEMKDVKSYAERFVNEHEDKLDVLIERLGQEIDLNATTRDLDHLLASVDPAKWLPEARREVLINYLGFPFWDVLTFPITGTRENGELREILIDRISPNDISASSALGGVESLKGIGFGHFAAFLSRAYRENDYLMGRLQALDRLIDIVCDSAGVHAMSPHIDVRALKERGFTRILDCEERHLVESKSLIGRLRERINRMANKE
jgi:hypothetical protein